MKKTSKKISIIKRLGWLGEWLIFWSFFRLVKACPARFAYLIGYALGMLLYGLGLGKRSSLRNLEKAFGTALGIKEKRRISRQSFRHNGRFLAEAGAIHRISVERWEEHFEVENLDLLLEAYQRKQGVILLSGHIGSWEFIHFMMAGLGIPIVGYLNAQENPLLEKLLNNLPLRKMSQTITKQKRLKQKGLRQMLRELSKGKLLLFLADQHFSKQELFVNFFDNLISAAPGAGMIHGATNATTLYTSCINKKPLHYKVSFRRFPLPIADLKNQGRELRKQAVWEYSQRYFQALETDILDFAGQYHWVHRRWKKLSPQSLGKFNQDALSHWKITKERPFQPLRMSAPSPPSPPSPPTPEDKRVLFLDRDGVLIKENGYLLQLEQLGLLSGTVAALKLARQKGWHLVMVTNQSGVARGLFDEKFVQKTHKRLQDLLAQKGASLDALYYSPWHIDGKAPWDRHHPDRKPGAGMLIKACKAQNLSLKGAVMVGDKLSDLQTGAALGVRPILVRSGQGRKTERDWDDKFAIEFRRRGGKVFDDLLSAVQEGL